MQNIGEIKMNLSCKEIVKKLDEYIIGQDGAKKAVAIALRNRYRRSKLTSQEREDITPKNIIMKGPTGVGKTEIARRLAKLVGAPFIKIEATKYTEVGYVGRDVESMIRDLLEVAIRLVRDEKNKTVKAKVETVVENRIIDLIIATRKLADPALIGTELREKVVTDLKAGKLEDEIVEAQIIMNAKPIEIGLGAGNEINIGDIFGGIMGGPGIAARKQKKKMTVAKARDAFMNEESEKLIDQEGLIAEAIMRTEQDGIIFIDEFDKIVSKGQKGGGSGPEVSREGVQRDILPLVEGSVVNTKYGAVKTDYILFIAAGAFHINRFEDLIPELQGRFPIRVELASLNKADFVKILTEPKNNIIDQYTALLKVDNIELNFKKDAIDTIAQFAQEQNDTLENLGARRLHGLIEKLLEDISFSADAQSHPVTKIDIDKKFAEIAFNKQQRESDLRKYIL